MAAEPIDCVDWRPAAVERGGLDLLDLPALGQRFGVGLQAVNPGVSRGRLIVPFHEPDCFFTAPALFPGVEQPVGVRLAKRGAILLKGGNVAKDCFLFPEETADHGVDEARLTHAFIALGQAHALICDGMVGNAIEEENLVQAKSKNFPHGRLLFAALGGTLDEPVEQSPPADAAGDQLACKPGIGRRQFGLAEGVAQQPLGCDLLSLRMK